MGVHGANPGKSNAMSVNPPPLCPLDLLPTFRKTQSCAPQAHGVLLKPHCPVTDKFKEARPVCSGCMRYSAQCVYPALSSAKPVPKQAELAPVPAEPNKHPELLPVVTPYTDTSIDDLSANQKRSLELLLLHKFNSAVYKTFAGFSDAEPRDVQRWLADAMNHALLHDFLLHIIFAVTALYLVLEPDGISSAMKRKNDFDFAKAHRMYLNIGLREQNDALSSVDASNAEALCWASFAATYIALGLLPDENEHGGWVLPVHLLSMQHGIATVWRAAAPFLRGTPVSEYSLADTGPDFIDPTAMYDYDYTGPLRKLLTYDTKSELLDEETNQCYDTVIAYINRTYKAIVSEREYTQPVYRRLSAFGAMIPKQFIDLVSQVRPRALAILAHHFAMMKCMDRTCWFKGLAERNVFGIRGRLPTQWQWAMDWPLKTMEQFSSLHPPATMLGV